MSLNKVFAQLYLCTHQLIEDSIGFFSIVYPNLYQYSLLWVHGSFKQLLSIHFSKTLIALLFDKSGLFNAVFLGIDFKAFFLSSLNSLGKDFFQLWFVIYKNAG